LRLLVADDLNRHRSLRVRDRAHQIAGVLDLAVADLRDDISGAESRLLGRAVLLDRRHEHAILNAEVGRELIAQALNADAQTPARAEDEPAAVAAEPLDGRGCRRHGRSRGPRGTGRARRTGWTGRTGHQ